MDTILLPRQKLLTKEDLLSTTNQAEPPMTPCTMRGKGERLHDRSVQRHQGTYYPCPAGKNASLQRRTTEPLPSPFLLNWQSLIGVSRLYRSMGHHQFCCVENQNFHVATPSKFFLIPHSACSKRDGWSFSHSSVITAWSFWKLQYMSWVIMWPTRLTHHSLEI